MLGGTGVTLAYRGAHMRDAIVTRSHRDTQP